MLGPLDSAASALAISVAVVAISTGLAFADPIPDLAVVWIVLFVVSCIVSAVLIGILISGRKMRRESDSDDPAGSLDGDCSLYGYEWSQTPHEATLVIPVPPGTSKAEIQYRLNTGSIELSVCPYFDATTDADFFAARGKDWGSRSTIKSENKFMKNSFKIWGHLCSNVKVDESQWQLDRNGGKCQLVVEFVKAHPCLWSCIIKQHPQIDMKQHPDYRERQED
jgi:hypothetical protein